MAFDYCDFVWQFKAHYVCSAYFPKKTFEFLSTEILYWKIWCSAFCHAEQPICVNIFAPEHNRHNPCVQETHAIGILLKLCWEFCTPTPSLCESLNTWMAIRAWNRPFSLDMLFLRQFVQIIDFFLFCHAWNWPFCCEFFKLGQMRWSLIPHWMRSVVWKSFALNLNRLQFNTLYPDGVEFTCTFQLGCIHVHICAVCGRMLVHQMQTALLRLF